MKWALHIIMCLSLLFDSALAGQREVYGQEHTKWMTLVEAAAKDKTKSAQKQAEQGFAQVEAAWASLSVEDKKNLAGGRWRDYQKMAGILLSEGQGSEAAEYLQKHVALCKEYGLSVSGNGYIQFEDWIKLHAQTVSSTGRDPLVGEDLPYQFGKWQGGFYALRQEGNGISREDDFNGIILPDLKETETSGYLVTLSRDGLSIATRNAVALTWPAAKGQTLRDRVSAVYPDPLAAVEGSHRLERRSPQALIQKLSADAPSSDPTELDKAVTSRRRSSAKTEATITPPTANHDWLLWLSVVILATGGAAWLFLRKSRR